MDRQKSRHHFPAQQQVVDAAYSYTQIHSQFMPLQPYYHSYQEFASPSLSAANVPIARTREDRPIGTVNEDTEPTTGNVESVTDVPLPDLVRKRPEYLQRYGNWAKWDALFDSHPFIQGLGIDQSPEEVEIAFRKLRGDLRDGDLQRQLTVALKKNLRDKKGASPSYIDIVASEWGRFLNISSPFQNCRSASFPRSPSFLCLRGRIESVAVSDPLHGALVDGRIPSKGSRPRTWRLRLPLPIRINS
jgi:hypothetical protein